MASLLFVLSTATVHAQQGSCEDANIDAMRGRSEIGASDQRRILDWVERQAAEFAGEAAFQTCFRTQYEHPGNSPQFREQLTTQTTRAAAELFAKRQVNPQVIRAFSRVLLNMDRPETFPGLIAGLSTADAQTRYLCARGLTAQRRSIAADKARLDQTVRALREAGLEETSPAVLGRIYEALAYADSNKAEVFDTYLNLFDRRLAFRRTAVFVDGAELYAFEFFRTDETLKSLKDEQKKQLVGRVAVFLRLDAERYNTPDLSFDEIDRIERLLDGEEDILTRLAGGTGKGGKVRGALSAGGYGNREAVLREAYRWVGDPQTNTPGTLNRAPWNVPLGAP